ncbi:type VII secretion integral membrane protein EccD [Asanoa sp. WMMD1127]|uniref:type VII secretion integral membrane protein EccD n=1 Tax=Asanoa sp. WMMD1127 TaxID=3016107 RepID=UPI002415F52F|nr:type VII secretion integral membrane protein EccD [Asanoa sp. WMMD1127]MDG4825056.1 type VII secretion integral membrane protein EccD [Asanoa sp. WMMD1127]
MCRLTVITPDRRVDVAVPDDITLADLAPFLLPTISGVENGLDAGGWILVRPDGRPLDTGRTPVAAGLVDGDLIMLTHPDRAPSVVFDDVADMVVAARVEAEPLWTRSIARVSTVAAIAIGETVMISIPLARPSMMLGAIGLVAVVTAVAVGILLSRALGDAMLGAAAAAAALPMAVLTLPMAMGIEPLRAPGLLVGAAALIVLAATGLVGVGQSSAVFVAVIGAGMALALGATLTMSVMTAVQAAAIMMTAAVGLGLAAPFLALRFVAVPIATVETDTAELAAPDRVSVFRRVHLAGHVLNGILSAAVLTIVGCATVGAITPTRAGAALSATAGVLLSLRARAYLHAAPRLIHLVGAAATIFLAGVACLRALPAATPVVLAVLALASGITAVSVAATHRDQRGSLFWPRAGDIVEALCVIALIPLTALVCGLFDAVLATAAR